MWACNAAATNSRRSMHMSRPCLLITIREWTLLALAVGLLHHNAAAADEREPRQPLFRVADLNVGESQDVVLSDGSKVTIALLDVEEARDKVRSAIRLARVKIKVNGAVTTIESGNYRLPVAVAGVQI